MQLQLRCSAVGQLVKAQYYHCAVGRCHTPLAGKHRERRSPWPAPRGVSSAREFINRVIEVSSWQLDKSCGPRHHQLFHCGLEMVAARSLKRLRRVPFPFFEKVAMITGHSLVVAVFLWLVAMETKNSSWRLRRRTVPA